MGSGPRSPRKEKRRRSPINALTRVDPAAKTQRQPTHKRKGHAVDGSIYRDPGSQVQGLRQKEARTEAQEAALCQALRPREGEGAYRQALGLLRAQPGSR